MGSQPCLKKKELTEEDEIISIYLHIQKHPNISIHPIQLSPRDDTNQFIEKEIYEPPKINSNKQIETISKEAISPQAEKNQSVFQSQDSSQQIKSILKYSGDLSPMLMKQNNKSSVSQRSIKKVSFNKKSTVYSSFKNPKK